MWVVQRPGSRGEAATRQHWLLALLVLVVNAGAAAALSPAPDWVEDFRFDHRRAELSTATLQDIGSFVRMVCVRVRPGTLIHVTGYTDPEEGVDARSRLALAARRAEAVAAVLIRLRVEPSLVLIAGGNADDLRSTGAMGVSADRNRIVRALIRPSAPSNPDGPAMCRPMPGAP